MSDPAEMHDAVWASRGNPPMPEEPEEEPPVEEAPRRYRPGRQEDLPPELVDRYEAARAAVIQQEEGASVVLARVTDEILGHTSYEDTEALAREEEVTVEATPDPPWEIGETLDILDADWDVVCQAEVLEADPPDYTLRGLPLGDVETEVRGEK